MFLIDSKKVIYEDISTVLVHNLLTYNNVIQMICKILTIQDIDSLPQFVKDHNINLVIRQGFRIIGNRESYIGMGYIYATSTYGVSVKKPRYDYISVNTYNDNNECIDIPAQLLMILDITTNTVTDSYYIVSYLTEEDNQNKNDKSLFATFKWEYIINNNTLCNNIDYIKPENLQGPAILFANYKDKSFLPSNYEANNKDSFKMIPRGFMDRDDWWDTQVDDILANTDNIIMTTSNTSLHNNEENDEDDDDDDDDDDDNDV